MIASTTVEVALNHSIELVTYVYFPACSYLSMSESLL